MKLALAILAAGQLFAQISYDSTKSVHLQGPVTRIEWVNPRAYIFIEVPTANWAVEIGNPLELETNGFTRTHVKIGDEVIVDATPARDSSKVARAKSVTLNGKKIFLISTTPAKPSTAP